MSKSGDNSPFQFVGWKHPTPPKKYYETYRVGNEVKFAPVLGLLVGQNCNVRVDYGNLSKAMKDPNFSIVIKPERFSVVHINNQDSLVLNAQALSSLQTVNISAWSTVSGTSITSMGIDVFIQSTREKIARIQYYCAGQINKDVTLIYTKFSNERRFPDYLVPQTFQTFLNNRSMHQLFFDFSIDTVQLSSNKKTHELESLDKENILDTLLMEYFGTSPLRVMDHTGITIS